MVELARARANFGAHVPTKMASPRSFIADKGALLVFVFNCVSY